MSDARTEILGKLRRGSTPDRAHAEIIQPAFVNRSGSLAELFKQKLEAVHSSVDIIGSLEEIEPSIMAFLDRHNCPMEVGLVPATRQKVLPAVQGLNYYSCKEFEGCQSVLTHAPLGIAETGTVLLPSSNERPTLANFLPDNCIVLIEEKNIVAYMEEALLEMQNGETGMQRALNLISGPSKTADIEQTLVYGAHGPIQLHVIVVQ